MLSIIPRHIIDDVRKDIQSLIQQINTPLRKKPFRYVLSLLLINIYRIMFMYHILKYIFGHCYMGVFFRSYDISKCIYLHYTSVHLRIFFLYTVVFPISIKTFVNYKFYYIYFHSFILFISSVC
jgi:hypothetical protein